jgi:K+-transporting ATPase KdpF subunit
LKMVVTVLYVVGAVGVTVYMLAALLRPEKF